LLALRILARIPSVSSLVSFITVPSNNDWQGEMCSSDEWPASNLTRITDVEPNTLAGSHGLTTRATARPTDGLYVLNVT
jgi:hypothetical protein